MAELQRGVEELTQPVAKLMAKLGQSSGIAALCSRTKRLTTFSTLWNASSK